MVIAAPRLSPFVNLLQTYGIEHARRARNGSPILYSAWEYDPNTQRPRVFMHSKTYGYVVASIDPGGLIRIQHTSVTSVQSRSLVAKEVALSFTTAFKRLKDRALNRQGGGGARHGYYLKHGIGAVACQRLTQARLAGEICVDLENELRRLNIGMSYHP